MPKKALPQIGLKEEDGIMICLKPMNDEEFVAYKDILVPSYAAEIARNQNVSLDAATTMAEKQTSEMLPQGLKSPDNYFYIISEVDTSSSFGHLWLLLKSKDNVRTLFIADIVVDEKYRGKKIGTKTLDLVNMKARELNCSSVSLHVFGHNVGALKLYESVDFEMTNIYMRKMVK